MPALREKMNWMGQERLRISRRTLRTFNSAIPGFLTRNLLRSPGTEARLGEPSKLTDKSRVSEPARMSQQVILCCVTGPLLQTLYPAIQT
jgi:hypothetical protein